MDTDKNGKERGRKKPYALTFKLQRMGTRGAVQGSALHLRLSTRGLVRKQIVPQNARGD